MPTRIGPNPVSLTVPISNDASACGARVAGSVRQATVASINEMHMTVRQSAGLIRPALRTENFAGSASSAWIVVQGLSKDVEGAVLGTDNDAAPGDGWGGGDGGARVELRELLAGGSIEHIQPAVARADVDATSRHDR